MHLQSNCYGKTTKAHSSLENKANIDNQGEQTLGSKSSR